MAIRRSWRINPISIPCLWVPIRKGNKMGKKKTSQKKKTDKIFDKGNPKGGSKGQGKKGPASPMSDKKK
jgi:hypothetical protein